MNPVTHAATALLLAAATASSALASDDEAKIRALEDRFAAAVNAGDVDGIMKNYAADESLLVFDVVPPRQHRGAEAYREAWLRFFASFEGTPKLAIADLGIVTDGTLAFSHSVVHVTGTSAAGRPVDRTVRVTAGYRKIRGSWLKVLEHISVPVDPATGTADMTSKE